MLFRGGFVPGLLLGFGQMGLVYYLARRYDFGLVDASEDVPSRSARRAANGRLVRSAPLQSAR